MRVLIMQEVSPAGLVELEGHELVRGIRKIEVVSTTCEVTDGQVSRWDVLVKMQFPVEPR